MFKKILSWLDNFWYHHKWKVIIVSIFTFAIGICVFSMVNRESYDVSILYTGPHLFKTEEKDAVVLSFESVMKTDYNGDGKKCVDLFDMTAFTNEQAESAIAQAENDGELLIINTYSFNTVSQSFSQQMLAGDSMICLLDPYWYGVILENGGLVPLASVLGSKPEYACDDYSVRLCDTDFGKYFTSLSSIPEDTLLCLRSMPVGTSIAGGKNAEKAYGYQKEFFKDILNFVLPAQQ